MEILSGRVVHIMVHNAVFLLAVFLIDDAISISIIFLPLVEYNIVRHHTPEKLNVKNIQLLLMLEKNC
jgi:hypothetical protein